jgi:hypothetical protein
VWVPYTLRFSPVIIQANFSSESMIWCSRWAVLGSSGVDVVVHRAHRVYRRVDAAADQVVVSYPAAVVSGRAWHSCVHLAKVSPGCDLEQRSALNSVAGDMDG